MDISSNRCCLAWGIYRVNIAKKRNCNAVSLFLCIISKIHIIIHKICIFMLCFFLRTIYKGVKIFTTDCMVAAIMSGNNMATNMIK